MGACHNCILNFFNLFKWRLGLHLATPDVEPPPIFLSPPDQICLSFPFFLLISSWFHCWKYPLPTSLHLSYRPDLPPATPLHHWFCYARIPWQWCKDSGWWQLWQLWRLWRLWRSPQTAAAILVWGGQQVSSLAFRPPAQEQRRRWIRQWPGQPMMPICWLPLTSKVGGLRATTVGNAETRVGCNIRALN